MIYESPLIEPNPFPKSIYENVAYGPRIHGLARNKSELDEIVSTFGPEVAAIFAALHRAHGNVFGNERVRYAGGELAIDSRQGKGTRITIELPLAVSFSGNRLPNSAKYSPMLCISCRHWFLSTASSCSSVSLDTSWMWLSPRRTPSTTSVLTSTPSVRSPLRAHSTASGLRSPAEVRAGS